MKNTKDIIREVANRTKYLKTPVSEIIIAFQDVVEENVINGETVRLSFADIGSKTINARSGVSPKTGEEYFSPEHKVPYIKMRKRFKNFFKENNNGEE